MNRDFLVTGAAQGLGLEFCRRILSGNGRVYMTDIDEEKGIKSKEQLQTEFGKNRVEFGKMDVTIEEEWTKVWDMAEAFFGGPVEGLANNAGVAGANWKLTLEVNMNGVLYGSMLAFKKMGVSNGGRGGVMVITGSCASFVSGATSRSYDATKHGVRGFVRAITGDVYNSDKIRVMGICPWFTDTNIVRSNMASSMVDTIKQRFGFPLMKPEEVGHFFERLVVTGRSGDMCVVMPDYSAFMWPNWNKQLLMIFVFLTRLARKVLGVPSTEVVTAANLRDMTLLILIVVFVVFHLLLTWIGL